MFGKQVLPCMHIICEQSLTLFKMIFSINCGTKTAQNPVRKTQIKLKMTNSAICPVRPYTTLREKLHLLDVNFQPLP